MKHIVLVGNPNCGKTTVFNALTGANQRVGNWPGVTVEKKTGCYLKKESIAITDLPGVYSLSATPSLSQDGKIAANALLSLEIDLIINVIDACYLERHLYLSSQILELGKPVIVLLNMMDIAKSRGLDIDIQGLARELGCPVLPIEAHKQTGFAAIDALIQETIAAAPIPLPMVLDFPLDVAHTLELLEQDLKKQGVDVLRAKYYARRIVESDSKLLQLPIAAEEYAQYCKQDFDIICADARYTKIHTLVAAVLKKSSDVSEYFTAKVDRLVLHRYLGLPIFAAIMYSMFLFTIKIGGAFQSVFATTTDIIFVQGSSALLQSLNTPPWLIALVAQGAGKGLNTIFTFIPVMGAMFFFMSVLEASGYMARAAFVMDKIMRALGLPGKAIVPMILGFGCNVPAIVATRAIDTERDRLLTIMLSPFMSCSARLAIYAVFVAVFFPCNGQNIVFSLYVLGIVMAVLTGFVLRQLNFGGKAAPLILELPTYHRPQLKRLFRDTYLRLRQFVGRSGYTIIPVCVILGALNAITLEGNLSTHVAHTHTLLSLIGQWITPIFAPMGLQQENWPATVGLLTGMLAKEVVIGALNSLYMQLGHGMTVSGMMAKYFDGQAGAYAYLVFVLLYVPCISTMAVIRQEANKKLMWFAIIWSCILAYITAVFIYQAATLMAHPVQSLSWDVGILFGVVIFLRFIVRYSQDDQATGAKKHVIANL